MNRLDRWYHRHVVIVLWLAMCVIVVLGMFAVRQSTERESRQNRDLIRTVSSAMCQVAEVQANALIDVAPPSTSDAQRMRHQASIDAYERALEQGLPGCDVRLHPAR